MKVNSKFEYCLLFFSGFIALSTFANVILDKIGLYFIEILLIPLILYYHQKKGILNYLFYLRYMTKGELVLFSLTVCSILIGIITTRNIFAVVTCIRPFLYILILIKLIQDSGIIIPVTKLYTLALGITLGDFVYARFLSAFAYANGYQHINIIAVALIIIIPLLLNNRLLFCASISFAIVLSVSSGYRINILIVFVALISTVCYLILTSQSLKYKAKYIIIALLIFYAIIWIVSNIQFVSSFLATKLHLSEATIYRSFDRIIGLLNSELTLGDKERLKAFLTPFSNFTKSMIPVGPIGKTNLSHFGSYTDVPILFFYDIYGSVLTWILLVGVAFFAINRIFSIMRNNERTVNQSLFVCMIPVVATLFILNGTFLTFVHIAIVCGLTLGGSSNSYDRHYSFRV